jgi:hypothetical protein
MGESLVFGRIDCRRAVLNNQKFTGSSHSPPFRGEREGPRRDSVGEGEVGSAANCLIGPLGRRSGNWFDRQHVLAFCAILLAIELGVFVFLIAGTHGWIVPLAEPASTDFVSFYAAPSTLSGPNLRRMRV